MVGTPRHFYQSLALMRYVQEYRPLVMLALGLHASGMSFDLALAFAFCSLSCASGHAHFGREALRLAARWLGTLSHKGVTMEVMLPEMNHLLKTERVFKKPELFHHLSELRGIRAGLLQPIEPEYSSLHCQNNFSMQSEGWEKLSPVVSKHALGNLSLAEATVPEFVKELEAARQEDGSFALDESNVERMYQALEDNRRPATQRAQEVVGVLQPVFAAHIDDLMSGTTFNGFRNELPPKEKGA